MYTYMPVNGNIALSFNEVQRITDAFEAANGENVINYFGMVDFAIRSLFTIDGMVIAAPLFLLGYLWKRTSLKHSENINYSRNDQKAQKAVKKSVKRGLKLGALGHLVFVSSSFFANILDTMRQHGSIEYAAVNKPSFFSDHIIYSMKHSEQALTYDSVTHELGHTLGRQRGGSGHDNIFHTAHNEIAESFNHLISSAGSLLDNIPYLPFLLDITYLFQAIPILALVGILINFAYGKKTPQPRKSASKQRVPTGSRAFA